MNAHQTSTDRIVPVDDDRDTGGFFRAARGHRLEIKACNGCGVFLHLPRDYCYHCGGWDTSWREVPGSGTLYAWTVAVQQFHPAYETPYTVVLVDIDEAPGVRLVGHLPGQPSLYVGQPMEIWWDHVDGDVVIPNWRPVAEG